MKHFLILIFLACLWPSLAHAQLPNNARLEKRWSFSHYRTANNEKILQSIFSGKDATTMGEEVLVNQFEMTSFRNGDTNQLQIIAHAPICFFNPDNHTAHSTNFLQAYTVSTNFYIEGRGFFASQSNSVLIVSNDVQTRFYKTLVKSSTLSASTNLETTTNDLVKIFSDHFEVQWESNSVVYTGHVRVFDDQLQLNCDLLVGRFNTNRLKVNAGIEQITALHNVVILTTNNGRATGEKAVYFIKDGAESIDLTGHAIWSDGQREARATRFVFDRNHNQLQAIGDVDIKFPNGQMIRTNASSNPLLTARTGSSTNGFTELFADQVTVQLSPTNGPPQSFLAENNVVITNRSEASRATAQKAFYTATNEQVQLTGNPLFQTSKGELRGRLLSIAGRTNQIVKSIGDAGLKLNLNGQGLARALKSTPDKPASTNSFLDIASDTLEYNANLITFTKDVHAQLFNETNLQGTLDCQLLTIELGASNLVQKISARDQVKAAQFPSLIEKRTVTCDAVTINFWPHTEFLRNAMAQGNVKAEQIGPSPQIAKFNANMVTALFASSSNLIERVEGESNIHGEQDKGNGKFTQIDGQRIVYTPNTTNSVQITGDPKAQYWIGDDEMKKHKSSGEYSMPPGIMVSAPTLLWDPRTQNFEGKGHPFDSHPIPARTNVLSSTNSASIAP